MPVTLYDRAGQPIKAADIVFTGLLTAGGNLDVPCPDATATTIAVAFAHGPNSAGSVGTLKWAISGSGASAVVRITSTDGSDACRVSGVIYQQNNITVIS